MSMAINHSFFSSTPFVYTLLSNFPSCMLMPSLNPHHVFPRNPSSPFLKYLTVQRKEVWWIWFSHRDQYMTQTLYNKEPINEPKNEERHPPSLEGGTRVRKPMNMMNMLYFPFTKIKSKSLDHLLHTKKSSKRHFLTVLLLPWYT